MKLLILAPLVDVGGLHTGVELELGEGRNVVFEKPLHATMHDGVFDTAQFFHAFLKLINVLVGHNKGLRRTLERASLLILAHSSV